LSYLPVKVGEAPTGGRFRVVNALVDSGSEIAVISRKHVAEFDCEPLAKVQLRAFIGTSVEADVVKLYISRVADTHDERCVAVCCAVCDDMREDLILTSSVIDKLGASQIDGVNVDHDLNKVDDNHHDDAYSNSQDSPVVNETVSATLAFGGRRSTWWW